MLLLQIKIPEKRLLKNHSCPIGKSKSKVSIICRRKTKIKKYLEEKFEKKICSAITKKKPCH